MNIYDIRRGDLVEFHEELSEEDKERIAKFARRISGESYMKNYALKIIKENPSMFRVNRSKKTKKKPTDYVLLTTADGVFIPVQARYLVVRERKPNHPLTSIFSDFNNRAGGESKKIIYG